MIKSFDIKNFKDKSSFEVSKIFKKNYIVTPEKSTLSLFANYRNLSVNLQSNFHYQ